jgi:peptidoglycan/LPS O-acetylase OafA/YrhL
MEQTEIKASPKLRAAFLLGAAVMLAIWGWSLVPAIKGWNNPHEDGFSFVPAFYGTVTFLPLGLIALLGGISGRGKRVAKARTALIIGTALLVLIVAFEIFAGISNALPG